MAGTPITLTDDEGRVRFEGRQVGGGGSQPVKVVRVPIAFDTPGLAATAGGASTGIMVYTPTPGDALYLPATYFSVPATGFDATAPATEAVFNLTFSDLASGFFNTALGPGDGTGAVDATGALPPFLEAIIGPSQWPTQFPELFPDVTPLRLVFDDGAQGDPGMTQGEGVLVLFIVAT